MTPKRRADIVDKFTRECPAIVVERSIDADLVVATFGRLALEIRTEARAVVVAWLVVWTGLGAWRMAGRDA